MKISILLPYKENFSPNYPGAVSLFVYETSKKSSYKKILQFTEALNLKRYFQLNIQILTYLIYL